MIPTRHLKALRKLVSGLEDHSINWVVTGSVGMALQGVPVEVHDIDIQTDKEGVYEIERCFDELIVKPVRYCASGRVWSHLGMLGIDGIEVEIMGDIQKRPDNERWEEWEGPVKVERYRRWVEIHKMRVSVLSLEYECQACLKLRREDKAAMLQTWLEANKGGLTSAST